jgi:hypothetical protein
MASFNISVLEEAVGDEQRSVLGLDTDGDRGAVMNAGPERPDFGQDFLFIGKQAYFFPTFILQIVVHFQDLRNHPANTTFVGI